MVESKELQELNSILLQQIAALKELIAIKDQIIASKSLVGYMPAIQSVPFIQTFPVPLFPQPYQPTITCDSLPPNTLQGQSGASSGSGTSESLGVISVTGCACGPGATHGMQAKAFSTLMTTLYGGNLVMDSHAIKLATNNIRKIV